MMQLGSEVRLELEPEVVRAVEVFGPEAGRMGAEVDVDGGAVGGDDFEREGMAGFGQTLPGEADAAGEFLGIHLGGNAGDEAGGLEFGGGLDHGVEGIDAGDDEEVGGLAGLFRHGDDGREEFFFVVGEELLGGELVFGGAGGDGADGHDHDIVTAQVGLFEDGEQVRHAVVIADGDEDAAGTSVDGFGGDFGLHVEVEFLEPAFFGVDAAFVDPFGDGENNEHEDGETHAVDGGDAFGEQIRNGDQKENEGGGGDAEIAGHLVFLVVPLVAQHEHAERFHEEAPHHAEGIRFAEQVDISAAQEDGKQLQADDHVDHARAGAEAFVRLVEPIHQDAILGPAVHYAVAADDGGVDGAGENQHADEYDEDAEQQAEEVRSGKVHGESAEQVDRKSTRLNSSH